MSELIKKGKNRNLRWKLLTEASALALMGCAATMPFARADDTDKPVVWIEVGGEFSRLQDSQETFAPRFLSLLPSAFPRPQRDERPSAYGFDEDASILFQPEGSDWRFSAAIRYGRASSEKHTRHQSYPLATLPHGTDYYPGPPPQTFHFTGFPVYPTAARFIDAEVKQSESHEVIDFQAGKDIGIGLFGNDKSSSIDIGVRFAQFLSKTRIALHEDPDWHFVSRHFTVVFTSYHGTAKHLESFAQPFHSYAGTFSASRSFRGLGPSISWNSSTPFLGNAQGGGLTFDLGVNGAVLFGRQKAKTHHQTTGRYRSVGTHYYHPGAAQLNVVYQGPATPDHTRTRNVIVPNIGASLGLSFRYAAAKVSFGYRGDFFFGAMDGGIDAAKKENVGFYGPFANISIGLGG